MKLVIVLIVLSASLFVPEAGECNSYDREQLNEGYHKCVYPDPIKGYLTIGVGFNLNKTGARSEIESVGANYNALINKTQCLTDSQIENLFDKDMNTAVSCASSWLNNWSDLGSGPQSAVADMAFNMGCSKLSGFVDMRSALEQKDYSKAVEAMKDSVWCRQVGSRCDRDVACMH